jgi:hydrogenase nickel incorporation protein HypA/HybF
MHELGIAAEVIDLACSRAAGARVTRVVLAIGRDTAVLPDAIRFCFELACEGTPAEGARLDILETPGDELTIKEMEVA